MKKWCVSTTQVQPAGWLSPMPFSTEVICAWFYSEEDAREWAALKGGLNVDWMDVKIVMDRE